MTTPASVAARRWAWLQLPVSLPAETVRHRTTAYIYGNVLVLAAVVAEGLDEVTGRGLVTVIGVAVSTFLAHVFAGAVTSTVWSWPNVLHQARDSAPILTSGLLPTLVLLTAVLGAPTRLAVILASLLLVLRLGLVGVLVARLRSQAPATGNVLAGVGLALVAVVIVFIKVTLSH